ncbi:hypothetical protein Tco_1106903 [Tanacetum coccineum]
MNQEEIRQVTVRDEKWVPTKERVKIGTTIVRLEPTLPQKEELFKPSLMSSRTQPASRHSLSLLKSLKSLCSIDAEVFRKILNICPRVQREDFTEVPDDESTLTFLINLGYKGPLHKHPNMYVDHMHQPWRTLVAIINKRLSG